MPPTLLSFMAGGPIDFVQLLVFLLCLDLWSGGQRCASEWERVLFALPIRLGGFGIRDPQQCCDEFDASVKVTLPLVGLVLEQQMQLDFSVLDVQCRSKQEVVALKYQKQCTLATELRSSLPSDLQRTLTLASEKGASSWLSALLSVHAVGALQLTMR